jgi:glycosyltransferase involved in cell wall biosynthesis
VRLFADRTGLEPATSAVTGQHSNQLNYRSFSNWERKYICFPYFTKNHSKKCILLYCSMKVSGFTIVRNAIKFDYPVLESINSILPLVDEMIVAVGNSEDNTLQLIETINSPKLKVIHSVWDDSLRKGGRLLAVETNKAMWATASDSDWCFYIQADEVLHEKYYETVYESMRLYKDDKNVDGLLFKYVHFYGNYNYIANSPKWYNREIRIVRKSNLITSWGDAQGFRKYSPNPQPDIEDWADIVLADGVLEKEIIANKLAVKPINASIYHYGWVKEPAAQQRKQETFHKMWHDDEWVQNNVVKADTYDYGIIDSLEKFEDAHPAVMQDRISQRNWMFDFDTQKSKMRFKYRFRKWLKDVLGVSIGEYRNYKVV